MTHRELKLVGIHTIALLLFISDRILKFYFIENPRVVGDFLFGIIQFRFVKNYGIAFGFPSSYDVALYQWMIIVFIFVLIFILMHYLFRAYQRNEMFTISALVAIIAGAISNMLDRIYYGFVIDYVDISFFTVLNIADIMISLGVVLIIIKELYTKDKISPDTFLEKVSPKSRGSG